MNTSSGTNFQRKIGLTSGICFVVGIIIGSGIFVSPKGVFQNANCDHQSASVIWVLSGLFSMLGALVYSELGTTIVRSGGDYAYLNAGFGSFVSFLYLWINLAVIRPASQAILALASAYYLLEPFKSCESWDFEVITRIISTVLIAVLGYINCVNVKSAIQLQNTFTVLKVLALAVIIVTGIGSFALGKLPSVFDESHIEDSENTKCQINYSLSIYTGLFAFGGWNYLNIITEELKDPYKNLPRSGILGILITTVIYLLANVAYFVTLTRAEILTSPTIALTFAGKVIGPIGLLPISLAISASAAGSLNANIFTSSRLFCMGAQEKHLPSVLAMLHFENCTPVLSVLLTVILTLLWLTVGNIYQIILMFSFAYWLWTGITVASGIYLRHRSPQMARPIKLPLFVLYLFTFFCLALSSASLFFDLSSSVGGLVLILLGVPIYWAKMLAKNKLKTVQKIIEHINTSIQKTFLIVDITVEESNQN